MAKILDGKIVRDEIAMKLKKITSHLKKHPILGIIQVGNLSESNAYIRQKQLFAERIGAEIKHVQLPENAKEDELLDEIRTLNVNRDVNGLIVQFPIPKQFNKEKIIGAIDPQKDVDGLRSKKFTPATARGVTELLKYYEVPIKGEKVLVIGQSELVGKPIARALVKEGAAVTVGHRGTQNLKELSKAAAIVVAAAGSPKLVTVDWVSPNQVIIDVGITIVEGKLIGDVDFSSVSEVVKAITPVPGGVGPMTVAALFENLLDTVLLRG